MREFKYGVGVIAPNFLLNLLLVKMSEKSLKKADFRSKNQKDMSDDGSRLKERQTIVRGHSGLFVRTFKFATQKQERKGG